MYRPNLKSVAFPTREIITIEVLGMGLLFPNLKEEEAVGGRDGTVGLRKSVGEFL